MVESRFLQVHWLASYPGTLLNRDDAGLAKRLPFGRATRTRISSQCLKRHWRVAQDERALDQIGVPMGKRSRRIVDEFVYKRLLEAGIEEAVSQTIAAAFLKSLFQESAKRAKSSKDEAASFSAETGQAVLFGMPEIEYLGSRALEIAQSASGAKDAESKVEAYFKNNDVKANLKAMKHHAGLESALFGRMVTSDIVANSDAAVHVAHAFTVHAEQSEQDYFTVVDDLKDRMDGDDAGAAGVFDMELTSGMYYGYVVLDVPLLVSNLEGCRPDKWLSDEVDRTLAGKVVEHLLHLIATVTPGAKKGSTAPYSYSELMMVEAGKRQPRTLANAFREPVPLVGESPLISRAGKQLSDYIALLDKNYGEHEVRNVMAFESTDGLGRKLSLPELATWASDTVVAGKA